MKNFPTKPFIAIVLAQMAVLGFMVFKRMHLLKTGKIVRLECVPVDPRSLFSGDYVILNYKISRLRNFQTFNLYKEKFRRMDTVYVALQKQAGSPYWKAVAVSHNRSKLKKRYKVVIRGVLRSPSAGWIKYGVEQYFVPLFEGKKIEKNLSNVSVDIAISKSGESAVKRLFLRNREIKFR